MSPRLAACRALLPVLQGKASLGSSLPEQQAKVAERDRPLVQELAFGTARWYPRLMALTSRCLEKPFKPADLDIQILLLLGCYQLLYTRIPAHAAIGETVDQASALKKSWAKGVINAVLRRVQREHSELLSSIDQHPHLRLAHPRWLYKRLNSDWPEQLEGICQANNGHPPLTLRVNPLRQSRAEYLAQLTAADITASACEHAAQGIRLETPQDVTQLPGFNAGCVSVQDEAAQLAAPLLELQPGQRVLDACCAPGGKTGQIAELQPELKHLLALDLEPARLQRVADNLQRLGLTAELKAADGRDLDTWWDGQAFDRILLDAPCSATGVIRRHPDIKLTRKPDDIAALASLQGELLDRLWQTLAVGGILVYATCSVLPEENREVIAAFLRRQSGARELSIALSAGIADQHGRQLFPQENGHDGFYLAKLVKIAANPSPGLQPTESAR
ncbi:MAG: 16S rRNA (cytosine(967)-C(5))-methyltransferase RsmB [Pseudomonadaceae bacterium]|nr:MAG: 16S rRNA (cytosine(967)-C(5))-methyltransferase RsmB [Pseudomonadaceae bacterium]